MPTGPTPRQRARADNIDRIKVLALDQLARSGAGELSLRAVARELNLVSSAIYRYFSSRDELITALIIDAYDDLATRLESADATSRRGPRRRWTDTAHIMRHWALAEPHRWALIYGSAIPGYEAPADTIAPAGRVVRALCLPATAERPPAGSRGTTHRPLRGQLSTAAAALALDVDPPAMLVLTETFATLVGALTLELNGHLVGAFEPADALFDALVERMADRLGL